MVDDRAGAELGDRQEARACHELVAASSRASSWDVGREREPREAVAGQKTLASEIAVAVEVRLREVLGFGQDFDLRLRLLTESPRLGSLALAPGVVHDVPVLGGAMVKSSGVQRAPALVRLLGGERNTGDRVVVPGRSALGRYSTFVQPV